MGNNKKNITILDNMDIVELELLQTNTEYAKKFLEEEGFDVQEVENYGIQHIKKVKFLATAMAKKQQDKTLFERAYSRVKEVIKENSQKTADVLIPLLHSKSPSVQYRKLEKWSDDEIREVLADIDLVTLMEELEKEN